MMKRCRGLVLILVFVLLFAPHVLARSHRFLDLEVDARVGADGLVRVTETHTVQFDGTFSGMFQWFETSGDIELSDVVVSEDGIAYQRLDTDTPGPAGSYFLRESDDEVYVDWSFEATDEIRHFELSYVVHNAILKHDDVAEFYYQFVGQRWDQPRDRVRAVLHLPFGAEQDEVAAWGHGPLHGVVTIESPSRIVWEVENLPAHTFMEGRVVFPNSLVPLGSRYTGETRLPAIFDEELAGEERRAEAQRLAQEREERSQQRRAYDPLVTGITLVLTLLLTALIWSNGRQAPGYQERYYTELPAQYPPAELAILYRQTVDSRDFTATLLDLARRGFLTIEEVVGLQGRGKDDSSYKFVRQQVQDGGRLRSYETMVLKTLFDDIGQEEVTLEEFQAYAKDNAKTFSKFWTEWVNEVREASKERQFFDPEAKKVLWFLIPILLLLGLGFIALGFELYMTGIVALVMSFVAVGFMVAAATRRSAKGHQEFTKWRAFRRYLQESSRVDMARVGSLGIWEQFLPYAVTLGVADRMLQQLEVRFPRLEQGDYRFASNWFVYYHLFGASRISHMTNSVGESVTKVTMPQGSGGTGGGFSGGGGGGFGGGGGGVR